MEPIRTKRQTPRGAVDTVLILVTLLLGCPVRAADPEPGGAGQVIRGVNLNGDAVGYFERDDPIRDDEGETWRTDAFIDTTNVVDPGPLTLYQTGVTGKFDHTFRSLVPGGEYKVRIHYVEVFAEKARERASQVSINGTIVRSAYDVFGATGAKYVATVKEYVVKADVSGSINVGFVPVDPLGGGVGATAIEISPLEPSVPEPVAWWPFDETKGNIATDALGARPGEVIGASWDSGRLGGALRFDASMGNHVRVDEIQGLATPAFSVFIWVKGGAPRQVILSQAGGENWLMAGDPYGALMTDLKSRGLLGKPLTSDKVKGAITDGTWHHVGLVWDGSNRILYVDSSEVAKDTQADLPSSAGSLYIGAGSSLAPDAFWDGSIDDVRVYDRALTQAQITQVWDDAQKTETTFYYPKAKPKVRGQDAIAPLTINLDRLGALAAVPAIDATEKDIRNFAESLDLNLLDIVEPGNIVLLGLTSTLDRLSLAGRAREIRSILTASDPLTEIGMVVREPNAIAPMLVLDEFGVKFKAKTSPEQIDELNAANGVEIVPDREMPGDPNVVLLRVTQKSQADAMKMANIYYENELTDYAAPSFVAAKELRQDTLRNVPDDEFFHDQWHLDNTGQNGGTIDADIDAPEAWQITTGRPDVVIAIIDAGFEIGHPDLVGNLWVNPDEEDDGEPDGIDDDGNGFIDDLHGWDFTTNTNTPAVHEHGTATAGCAGARGNNQIGVSGSCPNCSLMLVRYGATTFDDARAISYAAANGADVISNSWGYPSGTTGFPYVQDAIDRAASEGRNGLGCVVLFAMTNKNKDNGGNPYDISALDNVIAVSLATNQDRSNLAGFGNCMDVVAPSHGGSQWVATTDNHDGGYNCDNVYSSCGCPSPGKPSGNRDYTFCFNGTSAACPIVAGVAGLILSAAPDVNRVEVQHLLQDTADKIEPSVANYGLVNGFSLGPNGVSTHGYGRINAFEAVRVVGPKDKGGRGGVDVFVRDNALDWGNTEQPSSTLFEPTRGFIPYWESPDIKIDPHCGVEVPAIGAVAFAGLDYKNNLKAGGTNGIYVRVRNRGPRPASGVIVTLYWCAAEPNQAPDLPDGFWDESAGNSWDTTPWKPLGASAIGTLDYSGSSEAGTGKPGDRAGIASFKFSPGLDQAGPCCLLAVVHSEQDPVSDSVKRRVKLREITPYDNNITQRGVIIESSE
jgi:subtilisin family serine protease